jgi:hypothetical protein
MHAGNRIGIQFALGLAAYHRDHGISPHDGDLGFRCPACDEPLRPRAGGSDERHPAHFEHLAEGSTCLWAQGANLRSAARSEVLARYLTPQVSYAVAMGFIARISDDSDEWGSEGDARVPSPLRPTPFGRSSSASVPEPDDDHDVAAVAEPAKAIYTRSS